MDWNELAAYVNDDLLKEADIEFAYETAVTLAIEKLTEKEPAAAEALEKLHKVYWHLTKGLEQD